MIFAIFKCSLGIGADGISNISWKERILIYSFVIGSLILNSLYQSVVISLMLTESSMRSVQSFEELNDSNTKIYSYYDEATALRGSLPVMKPSLIMNYIDFRTSYQLSLPNEVDTKLAYLVTCRYADAFVHSTENYKQNQKIYDYLIINSLYQAYPVHTRFIYMDKFEQLVSDITESGIRNHWIKSMEYESEVLKRKKLPALEEERFFVELRDMWFPLQVLTIGSVVAFIIFILEIITKQLNERDVFWALKIRLWRRFYRWYHERYPYID
jgi:hypothetical protein